MDANYKEEKRMSNIYEKIQIVKQKLLEANIKKSGNNKFANYTYYELADFLPTIINLCVEQKLFTSVRFDDVLAYLEIINIEKTEEKVTYTSPMRELELKGCNKIQALGGIETYSRRYLYMSAFDIVENDMFDGAKPEEEKAKKITKQEADILLKILVDKGYTDEQVSQSLSKYKVKSIDELNTTQYAEILHKVKGE